jgi:RNA polymerase sigma factor (sigma-70 family)
MFAQPTVSTSASSMHASTSPPALPDTGREPVPPLGTSAVPPGLLPACLQGDPGAWERLLDTSVPVIRAIARVDFRLGPEDVEDVVQTVHLKLYEHLEELRDTAAFMPWLRRVTRHTIIDFLRQKRQIVSLDALTEETGREFAEPAWRDGAGNSAGDAAFALATRLDVQRALNALPALYREPVVYYLLQGKPQDEIGRLLGRPRSTVATQIQRGLEKLRRRLGDAYAA